MKLTLRVKRMLPKIHEALKAGEHEIDIRRRFSISPHLFKVIKDKWEASNEKNN